MADGIAAPRTTPSTRSSGGVGGWVREHKGISIGLGVAAAVGVYLYFRSRSKAANASNTNAATTATPAYPYSSGISSDTNFGDYYAGLLNSNQALANQVSSLGTDLLGAINGQAAQNNPSNNATNNGSSSGTTTPAPAPAPAAPSPSQGYGIVPTSAGQMVWLGVVDPGSPIYNVGGGAPVYFGNAANLAQGGQYEHAGQDIYTPVQYQSLVAHSTQPWSGPT